MVGVGTDDFISHYNLLDNYVPQKTILFEKWEKLKIVFEIAGDLEKIFLFNLDNEILVGKFFFLGHLQCPFSMKPVNFLFVSFFWQYSFLRSICKWTVIEFQKILCANIAFNTNWFWCFYAFIIWYFGFVFALTYTNTSQVLLIH